jgi:hypothetical protein
VAVTARTSSRGAIELRAPVADLVGAGDGTIVVVITRAGAGVDARAVASAPSAAADPPGVKTARIDVHVAR